MRREHHLSNICLRRGHLKKLRYSQKCTLLFFFYPTEELFCPCMSLRKPSFWHDFDGAEGKKGSAGGSRQMKLLQLVLLISNSLTIFQAYSITAVKKHNNWEKMWVSKHPLLFLDLNNQPFLVAAAQLLQKGSEHNKWCIPRSPTDTQLQSLFSTSLLQDTQDNQIPD